MDRISNLPDELICHIGSFLSAKEAAFAMVLSKRWQNLFTIIPDLQFDSLVKNRESFRGFVDGALALPVTSRIRKFSLQWWFEDTEPARYDYINHCLCHVLKLGVLDLEVRIHGKEGYRLPFEVFTSETVAKLTLGPGYAIAFLPANVFLPALKSLILHSVRIYEFDTLLSMCPVLEELYIFDFNQWKWSHTVSNPTIKTLTIHDNFDDWGHNDASEFESISFDTPALAYLHYSACALKDYPIVNLNSLVEAKIDIWRNNNGLINPINLIIGLKSVEILSLTDLTMELIHEFREAVPVFENLSHLTLVGENECCWDGLPVMLQKSPKLKTLTIDGYLHCSVEGESFFEPLCKCLLGYSFLLTCRIEVLKITKFYGDPGEMLQLKQVLGNLLCLELLELRVQIDDVYKELKIMKELLMIPRASSKCEILVI